MSEQRVQTASAALWFAGTVIFATALTVALCHVDRQMYDTHAPYLDMKAYRLNRLAATEVRSERVDEREYGSYSDAVAKEGKEGERVEAVHE